ncbi:MAG: hypothetical protein ACXW0R_14445 [Gaiellaceae bacterium]
MISTARSRLEEDVPALDIVVFARAGLLLPGDHTWEWDGMGGARPLRVIALDDVVEIRLWGGLRRGRRASLCRRARGIRVWRGTCGCGGGGAALIHSAVLRGVFVGDALRQH